MEILKSKLKAISDSYDDFVAGVMNYARRDPKHVQVLNEYIDSHPQANSSDITEFIIQQPDFFKYSVISNKE